MRTCRKALYAGTTVLTALTMCSSQAVSQVRPEHIGIGIGLGLLGTAIGNAINQQQRRPFPGQPIGRVRPPSPPPLTPDQIAANRSIQSALNARGYDAGTPDGHPGQKVRNAVMRFQKDNGFKPTGQMSGTQRAMLLAGAGAAAGALNPVFQGRAATRQPTVDLASTNELSAGPREIAIDPNDPIWASGTWTGSFQCRRRIYEVRLVVPRREAGAVAKLTYTFEGMNKPERGKGAVDLDASGPRLQATTLLSGEPDHPFGSIKVSESRGEPSFVSAPCRGSLALSRSPETKPKRAMDAAAVVQGRETRNGKAGSGEGETTSRTSYQGILGAWNGELSCGTQGGVRSVRIRVGSVGEIGGAGGAYPDQRLLSADRPGRLAAHIDQLVFSHGGGGTNATRLVGEYVPAEQNYRFVATSDPGGDAPIRNLILSEKDGAELTGSVPGERCSTIVARRPDPAEQPSRPAVRIPRNGGTFYSAQDLPSRCDALIAWGAAIEKDYADQIGRGQRVDTTGLYVDTDFVPVFGIVVDDPSRTVGPDISKTIAECRRDPLTRPRLDTLARATQTTIRNDGFHPNEFVYISSKVREARVALNRFGSARAAADRMSDPEEGLLHLAKATVVFEAAPIVLLPSRKASIVQAARATLSKSAERITGQKIAELPQLEPLPRLKRIRDFRSLDDAVSAQLGAEAKRTTLTRLEDAEKTAGKALFGDALTTAMEAPATLEEIARLDALPVNEYFPLLSSVGRAEFDQPWQDMRKAKIETAIDSELRDALPTFVGRKGLQDGAVWLDRFVSRWSKFQNEAPYKRAFAEFHSERKKQLTNALSDFRDLVRTNRDASGTVRNEFLVTSGDRRSPIALEYDFIAAGL